MPRRGKIRRRDFLKRIALSMALLISTFWIISNLDRVYNYMGSILTKNKAKPLTDDEIVKRTEKNYGSEIDRLAKEFKVPSIYLKALIVLEVGGRRPAPNRFEKGVFKKLKMLKEGKRSRYELLKKSTIANASEGALKNLATSWGAFQIMGYKCVQLGVNVSDIRGEKSLYWGVKWISEEYGKYLRNGRFKDAFHMHNAGTKYPRSGKPRTYHPHYVPNGLEYMEMFEQLT